MNHWQTTVKRYSAFSQHALIYCSYVRLSVSSPGPIKSKQKNKIKERDLGKRSSMIIKKNGKKNNNYYFCLYERSLGIL